MIIWHLTIDEIFPTANPFMRMHWAKRAKLIDAWYWLIMQQVCALTMTENSVREARKKRAVKVISYRTGNPDPPNLVLPSDKLVLDNLVKMGALVDDNAKWCKMDPPEIRKADAHGLRTVIEIREG